MVAEQCGVSTRVYSPPLSVDGVPERRLLVQTCGLVQSSRSGVFCSHPILIFHDIDRLVTVLSFVAIICNFVRVTVTA